jgi:nucleoside-diphosphate-sugar epimerase
MTMKIFLAGATGAIGRRLVPLLVAAGHAVTGTTRKPAHADAIRAAGAQPVVVDALNHEAVIAAIQEAKPEVVIHQLTAIPARLNLRKFDEEFAQTNRLRIEGTDNLIAGARAAGARRFIAQSYAAWPYARVGSLVKTEDDPLDADPPEKLRDRLAAIRHLEAAVLGLGKDGITGIVLRYGGFYGPGTSLGKDGSTVEEVRKRHFPLVSGANGVWSFIHIDDAAQATLAAVERGACGIYNITDDEPAPVSEWLPALAADLGAPQPMHLPRFIARLAVGKHGLIMMTEIRGASNAKAKRELGWTPRWASWRSGFREGLG